MAWDMWQHQNKVLHNSPENQAAILDAEIIQELQELYNLGPQVFPQMLFSSKNIAQKNSSSSQ